MSGKRFWIVVLSMAFVLATFAAAQDEKNEVGAIFGRTFISDQGIQNATFFDPTIHFGKPVSFEGEYARHLWVTPIYSISGEVVGMYDHNIGLNAGVYPNAVIPNRLTTYFITPAARVNLFPTTAVSPWVSFGAGFGHISESNLLLYGDGAKNPGKSTTSATIEGGIGLDVKVWKRLSARGEVRDFWSGEPDFPLAPTGKSRMHNFFVGGGAFWSF
jgi:hypothetical protein